MIPHTVLFQLQTNEQWISISFFFSLSFFLFALLFSFLPSFFFFLLFSFFFPLFSFLLFWSPSGPLSRALRTPRVPPSARAPWLSQGCHTLCAPLLKSWTEIRNDCLNFDFFLTTYTCYQACSGRTRLLSMLAHDGHICYQCFINHDLKGSWSNTRLFIRYFFRPPSSDRCEPYVKADRWKSENTLLYILEQTSNKALYIHQNPPKAVSFLISLC